MKWVFLLIALLLFGCAPVTEYQKVQAQLADEIKENDALNHDLNRCQDKTASLEMLLKEKPQKFFVKPPKISKEELDQIKKQAFEEAERKFKARMKMSK